MAGNELHELFCWLCSMPSLLQHFVDKLPVTDVIALRLTSPTLQRAVSLTIPAVTCASTAAGLKKELIQVFPAAKAVTVSVSSEPGRAALAELDACIFLQNLATTQQELLKRADELTIIVDVPTTPEVQLNVLQLLSSSAAQKVTIRWRSFTNDYNKASFSGQGSTPDQRRASMQRQLEAICASPTFFAPTSWPDHNSLRTLHWQSSGGADWFSSGLHAAFRTTSLVELVLDVPGTNDLEGCHGLSTICNLTFLAVSSKQPASQIARQQFAAATAGLNSLKYLSVHGSVLNQADLPGLPGAHVIPHAWSNLTNLTCLTLQDCTIRLDSMPLLQALCYMEMHKSTSVGSLSHLSALTALGTVIECTFTNGMAADEGGEAGGGGGLLLGPRVPPQWQQRLKDLRWHFREGDMPLLAHLHALTRLWLYRVALCPKLCWYLSRIPNLKDLQLEVDSVQEGYNTPAALQVSDSTRRPLLCSLQRLCIWSNDDDVSDCGLLQRFASWTEVPSSLQIQISIFESAGATDSYARHFHLEYTGLGAGWLPALLGSTKTAGVPGVALHLRDTAAATGLAQVLQAAGEAGLVLGSQEQLDVVLSLGKTMSAVGFRQLCAAGQHLPGGHLHIASPQYVGHIALEHLPGSFFRALPGMCAPGLRQVTLDESSTMRDADVAAIVSAATDLESLVLGHPSQLTDHALYALVGCCKLACVKLLGNCQVTAPGVVMLLTNTRQLLKEVLVAGVQPADAVEELQQVEWGRPTPAAHTWIVAVPVGSKATVQCILKQD